MLYGGVARGAQRPQKPCAFVLPTPRTIGKAGAEHNSVVLYTVHRRVMYEEHYQQRMSLYDDIMPCQCNIEHFSDKINFFSRMTVSRAGDSES